MHHSFVGADPRVGPFRHRTARHVVRLAPDFLCAGRHRGRPLQIL